MVRIVTDAPLYLLNPLHHTFTVKKLLLILALVITTFKASILNEKVYWYIPIDINITVLFQTSLPSLP